jgi:hypothetical protein
VSSSGIAAYTFNEQLRHGGGPSRGHLSFWLQGEKLRGGYALTRIREGGDETWLKVTKKHRGGNGFH